MRPGIIGGANWGGGAFDPSAASSLVSRPTWRTRAQARKNAEKTEDVDAATRSTRGGTVFHAGPAAEAAVRASTAIDLNAADRVARAVRRHAVAAAHPALKGVTLPEKLGAAGAAGCVVTKGGVIFVAGGGDALYAISTADGSDLWKMEMGRRVNATPMTYRSPAGRQIVVVASGVGVGARITAFALQ